ncbi:MAG: STAS domain-containing protein [Anaerolineales bacterium]|nr:STAS domain-containing protein [Anaerolineales bacterium]MCZ2121872.1 STAS domain-containing protein [Anaerolineales bacterium]
MDIVVSQEQGREAVTVLKIIGQLDSQSYQQLIETAKKEFAAGAKNFLLDLGELNYISSAGLVALHTIALILQGETLPDTEEGWRSLKSMDRTRQSGKQKNIKFLNPQEAVVSVLDMVGFSALFDVFADKQTAVNSF